mmetsp:Transcript_18741/g.59415  ORF Transcript_18741/g.59415 Transcript_18741/m.59415 type:complete len:228 (+) Transcript_18741:767-1450(+)
MGLTGSGRHVPRSSAPRQRLRSRARAPHAPASSSWTRRWISGTMCAAAATPQRTCSTTTRSCRASQVSQSTATTPAAARSEARGARARKAATAAVGRDAACAEHPSPPYAGSASPPPLPGRHPRHSHCRRRTSPMPRRRAPPRPQPRCALRRQASSSHACTRLEMPLLARGLSRPGCTATFPKLCATARSLPLAFRAWTRMARSRRNPLLGLTGTIIINYKQHDGVR